VTVLSPTSRDNLRQWVAALYSIYLFCVQNSSHRRCAQ
jgi:hypothetical protein